MRYLYNLLVYKAVIILKLVAAFHPKIKLFVNGRAEVFLKLAILDKTKTTVWIHAASLGEFEQGRPIVEAIKKQYPNVQILLTFFSPSGYEVRKNYALADVVCYLPLDTKTNVKKFIKNACPSLAIFIKYEFWPNYLIELKKNNIPTMLVSGIFRENQIFFKPYGVWMKKVLQGISFFFVQDKNSKKWLAAIGIKNVKVAGDTRFDRVQKLVEAQEKLSFVKEFKNNAYLLVAGSTWLEDEEKLVEYINHHANKGEKIIIAPHNIKAERIKKLKSSIQKPTLLFSEKEGKNLQSYQVMLVDTVGILSKIYAYAEVAYIGGGYTKSGVHNTLEAATYGLPIVIGPNYKKFKEVEDLVLLKGCESVNNTESLIEVLNNLKNKESLRIQKANITKKYVADNLGATQKIMKTINKILSS